MPRHRPVTLVESLGLRPLRAAAAQAWLTLRGDAHTPKTRFDLTSLRQLQPRWAVPLWLGRKPLGRRVPITNLFNHLQPPPELGWSVRVTQVRDFRGGRGTYDSHNGTDFAIPPGTEVVAAASGRVLRVSSEFHRGGRKVFVDHGGGLCTSYNHLARPLVSPGQVVRRGETLALSGYSGLDAFAGFPWTPPHVHFNVWLDGRYVDPFAHDGAASLWRHADGPRPTPLDEQAEEAVDSPWDDDAIARLATHAIHDGARGEIESAPTLAERRGAALFQLAYFPTRFDREPLGASCSLFREPHRREPRLDLPFSARDYDGVAFPER